MNFFIVIASFTAGAALCAAKENDGCRFLPSIVSPRAGLPVDFGGIDTGKLSSVYSCNQSIIIPDSFDPTLIPTTATELRLGDCGNGKGVSKINAKASPIPVMPQLSQLRLCNFDLSDGGADRLNALLVNLKGNSLSIHIDGGKLETLKSGLLAGFGKLATFEALNVGLKSVDVDSLSKLGNNPSFKELRLSSNNLTQFDLVVLEPVAKLLEVLELHENSLTKFTSSKPFSIPIVHVNIRNNQLTSIPLEALAVFNTVDMIAYDNPVCPKDAHCRCCSLAKVFRWMKNHSDATITLECGPKGPDQKDGKPWCPEATSRKPQLPGMCMQSCSMSSHVYTSDTIPDVKIFDTCPKDESMACSMLFPLDSALRI